MPDSVYSFREEILYRGLYRLSENGSVSSALSSREEKRNQRSLVRGPNDFNFEQRIRFYWNSFHYLSVY